MKPTLLIICDSHGTDWGCIGYASRLKERLDTKWEVTILAFPGVSLKKIYSNLLSNSLQRYDAIVIGVGNPDIHPRIPKKIISLLKAIGLTSARDSYFSVPPVINLSYLARLPLFIFRLLIVRLQIETYTSSSDLKTLISQTIQLLSSRTPALYILPLFKVKKSIYGKTHNLRAIEINEYLKENHYSNLISDNTITEDYYKNFYNYDFFHFTNSFQDNISTHIERRINRSLPTSTRKRHPKPPFSSIKPDTTI